MADLLTRFPCPSCGKRLKAPPSSAGRSIDCPNCGASMAVPGTLYRPAQLARTPTPPEGIARPSTVTNSVDQPAQPSIVRPLVLPASLLAGTAAVIILIIILIRKPTDSAPVAPVIDPKAAELTAAAEKAAAERAAAKRGAVAKAEADRKAQAEYTQFRQEMLAWIRECRSVSSPLRSDPSPPILHGKIRDAAERLSAALKIAESHLVRVGAVDEAPKGKDGDVIGLIWAQAAGFQQEIAPTEEMADLYWSMIRGGLGTVTGAMLERISLAGKSVDEVLDAYENLIKPEEMPTIQDVIRVEAKVEPARDRLRKAFPEMKKWLGQ